MKLSLTQPSIKTILLAFSFQLKFALIDLQNVLVFADTQQQLIHNRLIDKCCQIGKERAMESAKFNCKLSAREALIGSQSGRTLSALAAESLLAKDSSFGDQCEMVLESCCMGFHRTKNCDSGKQFAKSGAACMDVELSKEASVATESFNDCCMSCSLGILAAKNPSQNETTIAGGGSSANRSQVNLAARCKLISPLASSLSGQLYEQTYVECCNENLPRVSNALTEPGAPIDCIQSNPCSQRCIPAASFELVQHSGRNKRDRCDCFAGYKLASDGVNCLDIDECKLGLHSCNKQNEICDNIRGSFRCLARQSSLFGRSATVDEDSESGLAESDSASLDSSAEFSSLRLCAPGSRWNSVEAKCQQVEAQQERSASLLASSQHRASSRLTINDWS